MAETSIRRPHLLIVVKGYPRVSETFIAQELLGLEQAGIDFEIVSLRAPYDAFRHPIHDQIKAPIRYLPERLRDAPGRVLGAAWKVARHGGLGRVLGSVAADLMRDPSRDRVRRFGQALVLAAEASEDPIWLYAHFAHTPATVARYAALARRAPYSVSAHAKDIWTSDPRDLSAKLSEAHWWVTCTQTGRRRLLEISPEAPVHLLYHGLDLARFPEGAPPRPARDGTDPSDPVRILSVGRAVPKKGYDLILEALGMLPEGLHWRFEHIGSGAELATLKAMTTKLGLRDRVAWLGPMNQVEVLEAYRRSDLFVLASRATADGDRDGLPNVIVEAASQGLPPVATDFSAIPELVEHGVSGLLVPPDDPEALSKALETSITSPDLRLSMGQAAEARVRRDFDAGPGIQRLKDIFEASWAEMR